jgi:hypothetical protein
MNTGSSRREARTDFSSFMPIVLMTIGWCAIVMFVNVLIISSNPENVQITSVVRTGSSGDSVRTGLKEGLPFPSGNKVKEPAYVDVHRDHLVVYPGAEVVSVADLEKAGNAFERMVKSVAAKKDEQYVILLLRPRAALVARQLRNVLRDKGIDTGCELYEEDRPLDYDEAAMKVRGFSVR